MNVDCTPSNSIVGEVTKESFYEKAVNSMQEIIQDNEKRMKNYKSDPAKFLKEGVFYANEYYAALNECKDQKDLQDLKAKMVANDIFYNGYADPKYFNPVVSFDCASGIVPFCFVLKLGALPSEALKALKCGLTLMDCTGACQFAYYSALLDVLGQDKFNAIFASSGKTPLAISTRGFGTRAPPIMYLTKKLDQNAPFEKGQWVFIPGIAKLYEKKHFNGEAVAYNTLCSEAGHHPKFIGLGLNKEGLIEEGVYKVLFDEYNKQPASDDMFTPDLAKKILNSVPLGRIEEIKSLQDHQITWNKFCRARTDKTIQNVIRMERVNALLKASIEEAPKLLSQWMEGNSKEKKVKEVKGKKKLTKREKAEEISRQQRIRMAAGQRRNRSSRSKNS